MTDIRDPALREAVAVFESESDLQVAIDELLSRGFDRAEISLLASEHAVEQKLGHKYRRVVQLEDDLEAPRTAFVSTESLGDAEGSLIGAPLYVGATAAAGAILVSGGSLAAAIAGAAVAGGAGAAIGSVLASFLGKHHAQHVAEQIEHGGLLLWVRTWDAKDETNAIEILRRHSGKDVHVHSFEV
jgi:hypothetical protein